MATFVDRPPYGLEESSLVLWLSYSLRKECTLLGELLWFLLVLQFRK